MEAVITDMTFPKLRATAELALEESRQSEPTGQELPPWDDECLRREVTDPVWALEGDLARETGELLEGFIDRVKVRRDMAQVRYLFPLPPGSSKAGAVTQDIPLPESVLA